MSIGLDQLECETGGRPTGLEEMEALVDGCFAAYARHAVAVKSLAGYERRLDFAAADPAASTSPPPPPARQPPDAPAAWDAPPSTACR